MYLGNSSSLGGLRGGRLLGCGRCRGGRGGRVFGRVQAGLDQRLACKEGTHLTTWIGKIGSRARTFGLGNERLQLGGCKCVDIASLGGNQQQHLRKQQYERLLPMCASVRRHYLRACERAQLVGLLDEASLPLAEGHVSPAFVINKFNVDLTPSSLLLAAVLECSR